MHILKKKCIFVHIWFCIFVHILCIFMYMIFLHICAYFGFAYFCIFMLAIIFNDQAFSGIFAPRLYKSYNHFQCARRADVAESNCSITVEVRFCCQELKPCQQVIATDEIWEKENIGSIGHRMFNSNWAKIGVEFISLCTFFAQFSLAIDDLRQVRSSLRTEILKFMTDLQDWAMKSWSVTQYMIE